MIEIAEIIISIVVLGGIAWAWRRWSLFKYFLFAGLVLLGGALMVNLGPSPVWMRWLGSGYMVVFGWVFIWGTWLEVEADHRKKQKMVFFSVVCVLILSPLIAAYLSGDHRDASDCNLPAKRVANQGGLTQPSQSGVAQPG